MKIGFLITLLVTGIHFSTIAQETSEGKIFDYSETKHELSLDFAPIIQRNYPSSLLYRQHYVSKNGKNVALRIGASLNAGFSSYINDGGNQNDLYSNNQGINVYVGKEWQKNLHPRIIGYYGVDFGAGFGRNKIIDPNRGNDRIKRSFINFNSTGFLGMRYHFSKHFSVSAETSASLNFNSATNIIEKPNDPIINEYFSSFGLSMAPLRAIRFAFHF